MTTTTKTPRLLEAAKEFNIGRETLVAFLGEKGFVISSNPSSRLDEKMYNALQVEFAQDKLAKRKSDEIALPKGSLMDNLRKGKDEPVAATPKDKKDDSQATQSTPLATQATVPTQPSEKPKTPVTETKKPVIEEKTKPVIQDVVKEISEPIVIKPEITDETINAAKQADKPSVKLKETKSKSSGEEQIALEQTSEQKSELPDSEHVEIKAPKIEGPNILGKINLEELNLASRPKKGAVKKKEEKKVTKSEPKLASSKSKTTATESETKPVADSIKEDVVEKIQSVAAQPIVIDTDLESEKDGDQSFKPEHIEMKAPKLEGPKIIGKIDLPISQSTGNTRPDNREKRKRKRIPVDKKPDGTRPDQNGGNNNRGGIGGDRDRSRGQGVVNRGQPTNRGNSGIGGPGGSQPGGDRQRTGGGNFQGQGGQRHGGAPGQNNNPRTGGGNNNAGRPEKRQFGGSASGGRDDRRNFKGAPVTQQQQQEIDTKAIQDKIRETQAKLTGSTRSKNLKAKYRRNKRDEMAEKRMAAENAEQTNIIQVTEFISVSELASLLNVSFADVISKCMGLGIMVSINQRLDAEVIELVSSEFGYIVEFINLEQEVEEEEEIIDDEEDLKPRAPIVTIMGHVDHGKTSLLDYIRSANVVAGEAGGITQHIGAYQVTTAAGKKVTFLDTPGHEAFTAMRARGAKVADVAVIVIAADDAIMPQTKEAISHAQAANLPMIFAINKIDKPGSNPEKIKEQLANMNILVEDWGGTFQCQEISAKKGLNVDTLLEKIGLEAEMLDLKANPDRIATGSVIEASLDKGRGYQSTILVQNGTLQQGDMIACGQNFGKIKAMFNERGQRVKVAGPSAPVQVLGLNGAPQAGEKFKVYLNEDEAKEVATHRAQIMREQGIRARKHITLDEIGRRLALGNFKELGVIIKGDFDGSVEALSDSLQKLSTEEVSVNVVHKGVGQITESDVLLATASDAIILGFQVRPSMQAAKLAEQENIEIRTYSIIYDAIDEIKSAMEGLLEPKIEKRTVSNIEVREIYKISGIGTIAGCYVLDGKMTRQTKLNLVRDGIVVYTGELASLKRFKDDVKDVNAGYECGLSIKNYADVRVGDIIEGFDEVEVKRTL